MISLSEIQILPVKPQNGLVAFASFVLNKSFYMGSVAIHSRLDGKGYRLTFPTKSGVNLYHPIKKEVTDEILKQISPELVRIRGTG